MTNTASDSMTDDLNPFSREWIAARERALHDFQMDKRRGKVAPPSAPALDLENKRHMEELVRLPAPAFEEVMRLAESHPGMATVVTVARTLRASTAREKLDVVLEAIRSWRYPDDPLCEEGRLIQLHLLAEFLDDEVQAIRKEQAPVFDAFWVARDAAEKMAQDGPTSD